MKRIFKYTIEAKDAQAVVMPEGAEILSVQVQGGTGAICIWALVNPDPNIRRVERSILIVGTGNPVPDDPGKFLGTVQLYAGELVFHVFEMGA